ncbi:hypothetical protein AV530_004293 [Patagioenas fasciata monilis]|uniref:Uncharacterized protein n=1 Tax=Patagioenas fasciata monilis TaxID=372326 RepID=A0A1V4K907_PATFA|nr:hypothetical protein AV530_004293 [Patagioenas fasciata monilis]
MLYIDHLSNLCLECDPQFLQEVHLYLSIKKKRRRETSGIFKYQSLTPEQLSEELVKEEEKKVALEGNDDNLLHWISNMTLISWRRSQVQK